MNRAEAADAFRDGIDAEIARTDLERDKERTMRRILCAAALAVGWATLSNCSGDTLTAGQMPGDDGGAGKATGSGSAGSSSTTGQAGSSTTSSNMGGAPGSGGEGGAPTGGTAGSPGAGGEGGKGSSTGGAGNGGGKGGGAGKGGIGGDAGAGGGAAGSGGKTTDAGTDCATMRANVEKLMAAAQKCSPTQPTPPCTQRVESFCCPITVTDANAQATLDYLAALGPYKKMCPMPCPAIACTTGPGVCMATSAASTPTCVP